MCIRDRLGLCPDAAGLRGVSVPVRGRLSFEMCIRDSSKIIRSLMITPTMIAPIVASLMWLFMFNADYGVIKWLLQLLSLIHIS